MSSTISILANMMSAGWNGRSADIAGGIFEPHEMRIAAHQLKGLINLSKRILEHHDQNGSNLPIDLINNISFTLHEIHKESS